MTGFFSYIEKIMHEGQQLENKRNYSAYNARIDETKHNNHNRSQTTEDLESNTETVLNDNYSHNSIKYNISESVKQHYQKENDTNENAKPKANTKNETNKSATSKSYCPVSQTIKDTWEDCEDELKTEMSAIQASYESKINNLNWKRNIVAQVLPTGWADKPNNNEESTGWKSKEGNNKMIKNKRKNYAPLQGKNCPITYYPINHFLKKGMDDDTSTLTIMTNNTTKIKLCESQADATLYLVTNIASTLRTTLSNKK